MISRLMVVYSAASALHFHRISCSQLWRCSATSSCVTRPWPRPGALWPSRAGWWAWWSVWPSSPPPPGSGTGHTLSGHLQVNVARIINVKWGQNRILKQLCNVRPHFSIWLGGSGSCYIQNWQNREFSIFPEILWKNGSRCLKLLKFKLQNWVEYL